tara:strand:- start:784 stop:1146 length:363 start_codon:yes stop_codon:yes gene_type:complete
MSLLFIFIFCAQDLATDKLINAIIYVESRGDDLAYNSKENAAGCLQIRPIALKEVNRLVGYNKYTLKDRWSRAKSIEMFNVIKSNIKNPTDEIIARTWNGGYNFSKSSTDDYWQKVKNRL